MTSGGGIAAIVTDIEGTTTPISFVKASLFPYARQHLAGWVAKHAGDDAVRNALNETRTLIGQDAADDATVDDATAIAALIDWIDQDRKAAPLKTLQGMIWEDGYRSGELKAPVYRDVKPALEGWRQSGIGLYVYSSGSVAAQKLLFGHSDQGDLTGLFSGWFDLETGSKLEPHSYQRIADAIGHKPEAILFLSDHPGELDAAVEAGLQTIRLDRGDPPPAPAGAHKTVRSFAEIEVA